MDEFRKKINFRFNLCLMFCCSGSAIYWLLHRLVENVPDFSRGMIFGMFIAMDFLAVFYMIKCQMLLRNEDKLKAEYIKSKDERNNEISKETMRTSSLITLMGTGLAILVTGFFSKTVSLTLFISMTASALITVLVFAYYNKKM